MDKQRRRRQKVLPPAARAEDGRALRLHHALKANPKHPSEVTALQLTNEYLNPASRALFQHYISSSRWRSALTGVLEMAFRNSLVDGCTEDVEQDDSKSTGERRVLDAFHKNMEERIRLREDIKNVQEQIELLKLENEFLWAELNNENLDHWPWDVVKSEDDDESSCDSDSIDTGLPVQISGDSDSSGAASTTSDSELE